MRQAKKIMGLLLALILVLAMAIPAFAESDTTGATKGSITIKPTTNISLDGRTFTAYKILDAKKVGDGYVYTVPANMKDFYVTEFTLSATDPEFDAKVAKAILAKKDNAEALFEFAGHAQKYCSDNKIAGATGNADGKNYTIPNLDSGYYVIQDNGTKKPVSALMLDTVVTSNKAVEIKADAPTVDKKITSTTTDQTQKTNNVSIGDEVEYTIKSKVPDMTGYKGYTFVLHDTLDKGLTFTEATANMTITVDGDPLTKCDGSTPHTKCYELKTSTTADGKTKIDITFKNFIQYANKTDAEVVVTYKVTLNENAVIGGANVNTVKLQYSNDPSKSGTGDPDNPDPNDPTGETTESKTSTYTTEVKLIKENGVGDKLAGAQFHIEGTAMNTVLTKGYVFTEDPDGTYWKLLDGSYTTTAPVTDNEDPELNTGDKYADPDTKYKKELKEGTAVETKDVDLWVETDSTGVIDLKGLGAGDYTITEVKAPDGYNLLDGSISLKIEWTRPATANDDCTWTYTWNGKAGSNEYTVINETGNLMPSTGGIGTTIFYVAGSIMLIGAAVILITKRRVNAEK